MSITRSNILKGPGTVKLGDVLFYDQDGIDANVEIERFPILNSSDGQVDTRLDDKTVKTTFTPAGEVADADLTALFPHQTPVIGASLFGASDTAAIIHSKAGQKLTLHSAAITKMPDIMLSPGKTPFGQAEITAILKNNGNPATDDSLYTVAAEAFSDTSFATANVKTLVYTGVWTDIFASIITEEGWTITFDMGIKFQKVDDAGTVDAYLESVEVLAKCKSVNLSEGTIWDALRIQDTGATRGTSLRQGKDLVITGAGNGFIVTIKDASLVEGPLRWGSTDLRAGEIGFIGHRAESAGTFGALFTLSQS